MMKEFLFDNLKALGERGHIRLLNDDDIKASLRSVQEDWIIKEGTETKRKIFARDNDIAEGIIRAAICAKDKNIKMDIYSIRV